ncbi:hypothetical protein F4777DRAFT_52019 [Nemania sp. FL0916]|nr:hypothetical protein F4777DRAFT_52019 [Nemania sp. FL0916]
MALQSDKEEGTFLGYMEGIPCHSCTLRGNGIMDPDSNWRLWNADIKVYRDATAEDDDGEEFPSEDARLRAKADRKRKALMWFTVSEALRAEHLVDLGGRESSSNDVFRRLFDRVAPPGTPYEPPPPILLKDKETTGTKAKTKAKAKSKKPASTKKT